MRYLKKFNESLIGDKANDKIRIAGNIKDIFVGYQDSQDLDVDIETFAPGLGLPSTLMHLDDNVLMVKLFAQRGIRFNEISGEIGMLIEYMKSLTDKEVKIYYDLDRSGLRNWRPLAGSDNEFDYYLQGKGSMVFNTIRMYFVEDNSVKESFVWGASDRQKALADVTDMFIELNDSGINYTVSTLKSNTLDITIFNKKRNDVIDLDLVRDCVEMAKDYLSSLGNFTEFYRFGYRWDGVTTRMTNAGPIDDLSTKRDSIEYSSFPYDFIADVENKHSLVHRFDYVLEGIKIVFTLNEN